MAHWIQAMHMQKGALHRALGVATSRPIPPGRVAQAANSTNPHLARMARLAQTLRGFNK